MLSPRYIPGGSLKKLGTDSIAICGAWYDFARALSCGGVSSWPTSEIAANVLKATRHRMRHRFMEGILVRKGPIVKGRGSADRSDMEKILQGRRAATVLVVEDDLSLQALAT